MISFKAENAVPLQRQIAEHIAARILSGELPDGARLPSTLELAKSYSVTPVTIHKSLQHLVRRQLIERCSRKGTFVCSRERTNVIALVFGKSPFTHPGNFYTSLITLFQQEACRREVNLKIYFDFEDNPKTRFDLEQDIRSGELKGMVAANRGPLLRKLLDAYPDIPRCYPISIDFREEVRQGVAYLVERGYRNIGVVSMLSENFEADYSRKWFEEECRGAEEAVAGTGARLDIRRCDYTEVAGYRKAKEWLREPAGRPDAIFVNHDIIVHGMMLAIVESGLRIPEDIALLVHMNGGNEFASPVPLTKYEIDTAGMVRNCLDSLYEAMRSGGRGTVSLPVVPGRIVPGLSCGEAPDHTTTGRKP